MTNIVPHPALRRQELLASLGARPSPSAFFDALSVFQQEKWDTSGYVLLAQALTGYKLIEDVVLLDRLTNWPAFRLVRQSGAEAE